MFKNTLLLIALNFFILISFELTNGKKWCDDRRCNEADTCCGP
uniref:Uncharacterized protein n=1 Tax=Meloidogyne javanica TaxID=6303 RepID=A0A915N492_MELJA